MDSPFLPEVYYLVHELEKFRVGWENAVIHFVKANSSNID